MRFAFSDEQEALRKEVRRFLLSLDGAPRRRLLEREGAFDPDLWRRLADLGWLGLTVPEAYGGAGLSFIEVCALLEEAGRAILPGPLFSTLCLGVEALVLGGSEGQRRRWLPALAEGRARATLAFTDGTAPTRAIPDGEAVRLDGEKRLVLDGAGAELLVVTAREESGGLGLYLVEASAPGLDRRWTPGLDLTRPLATVTLAGVRLPAAARLPGNGAALLERLLARAAIALAAEQVGGAERCLELSVEYAKTRVQFGRPIGSFQAVKHTLADMLTRVESARSAAWWAAWVASEEEAELPVAAPLARAFCSEAFFRCAADAIQVHGGIGFTWEHDAHLLLRRARASGAIFGDAAQAREALAGRIL